MDSRGECPLGSVHPYLKQFRRIFDTHDVETNCAKMTTIIGGLRVWKVSAHRSRDVAQLGSALRSGRRSRRFKSCHPDPASQR